MTLSLQTFVSALHLMLFEVTVPAPMPMPTQRSLAVVTGKVGRQRTTIWYVPFSRGRVYSTYGPLLRAVAAV